MTVDAPVDEPRHDLVALRVETMIGTGLWYAVGELGELKYFLVQFITKHYGRMRATVKTHYAESLYYLESSLADAAIANAQRNQTIERFLTGTSDEIEIQVKNVTFEDIEQSPYRATVEFDRVHSPAATARNTLATPASRTLPSSCATKSPTPPSLSAPSASG